MVARERDPNLFSTIKSHKKHNTFWDINNNEKLHYFAKTNCTLNTGCPNMFGTGLMQYSEAQKFASEDYEFYAKMYSAP